MRQKQTQKSDTPLIINTNNQEFSEVGLGKTEYCATYEGTRNPGENFHSSFAMNHSKTIGGDPSDSCRKPLDKVPVNNSSLYFAGHGCITDTEIQSAEATADERGISKRTTYIILVLIVFVQISFAAWPILVKNYGRDQKIDMASLSAFRIFFVSISMPVAAYIFEGPISLRTTLRGFLGLMGMGLLGCCLGPLAADWLCISSKVNFFLTILQMQPIFNAIISYLFKIEDVPSPKDASSILVLSGIAISSVCSLVVVGFNLKHSCSTAAAFQAWIVSTMVSVFLLLAYAFFFSYQVVKYTYCTSSRFFMKPLTFLSVCSLYSYTVYFPTVMIGVTANWHAIQLSLKMYEVWVVLLYTGCVCGAFQNVSVNFCNSRTSPLFVGSTYTIGIVSGMFLAAIFLDERLELGQYVMSAGIVIGMILVLSGKALKERIVSPR